MDVRLSEGEDVIRRYRCTAHDGCIPLIGSVIPFRFGASADSECVITVTDRRVLCDTGGDGRKAPVHQEVGIPHITSVYSLIYRFNRDIRLPLVLAVAAVLLMVAPLVYAYATDAVDTAGDYTDGYNDGVRYGYYTTYLASVQAGTVANSIPAGFEADVDPYGSSKYDKGYAEGLKVGSKDATADVAANRAFSVPTGEYLSDSIATVSLACCIVGVVLFTVGAVIMAADVRARGWIVMRLGGPGSKQLLVSRVIDETDGTDFGDDVDLTLMELGAVIMDIKAGFIVPPAEMRLRVGGGAE